MKFIAHLNLGSAKALIITSNGGEFEAFDSANLSLGDTVSVKEGNLDVVFQNGLNISITDGNSLYIDSSVAQMIPALQDCKFNLNSLDKFLSNANSSILHGDNIDLSSVNQFTSNDQSPHLQKSLELNFSGDILSDDDNSAFVKRENIIFKEQIFEENHTKQSVIIDLDDDTKMLI